MKAVFFCNFAVANTEQQNSHIFSEFFAFMNLFTISDGVNNIRHKKTPQERRRK